MTDVRLIELAARQHGCVARRQLNALGYDDEAIAHRVSERRLVRMHEGVYAVAPLLGEERARRMAATLTTPESALSHAAAAAAWGFRSFKPQVQIITRPGDGGPELWDGVLVCRSRTLVGNTTTHEGIPITTPERTLIDLAPHLDAKALARAVREACRLKLTTPSELFVAIARHRGRRGVRRLHAAVSRYAGLPLHRTKSDAEALALALLREAGRSPTLVNEKLAGEEADLIWPDTDLIVELDGLDRPPPPNRRRVSPP